jgi:hypothetical protein
MPDLTEKQKAYLRVLVYQSTFSTHSDSSDNSSIPDSSINYDAPDSAINSDVLANSINSDNPASSISSDNPDAPASVDISLDPANSENLDDKLQELALVGQTNLHDGDLFELFENLCKHEIRDWRDLTSSDYSYLVYALKKQIPLNERQLLMCKSSFKTLEEVSKRLNRTVDTWDAIYLFDYILLMKNPNRFQIIPYAIPLKCEFDYEYGKQLYIHKKNLVDPGERDYQMFYLRFYNFMMLDFDKISYDELLHRLNPLVEKGHYFRIYQTFNGFHVFVCSEMFPFNEKRSMSLMKMLQCDHFYCLFSYKFGYNIRLNKKYSRNEDFVAKYHSSLGPEEHYLPELAILMNIHDAYLEKHANN